jgi:hypothetical protein
LLPDFLFFAALLSFVKVVSAISSSDAITAISSSDSSLSLAAPFAAAAGCFGVLPAA